jgi:hypothetical protein
VIFVPFCYNLRSELPFTKVFVVYYEEIKRELQKILIYECRCNARLKATAEGSTRLAYTGLRGGLEYLKTETRLRGERLEVVKGESVI